MMSKPKSSFSNYCMQIDAEEFFACELIRLKRALKANLGSTV